MSWEMAALVGAGGAVGALMRFALTRALAEFSNRRDFPLNTLLINLGGSALLGWLMASAQSADLPVHESPLFMVAGLGFCGALTTFSTFAVETRQLAARSFWRALGYVVLTVGGGVGSFALALILSG
ncbi:CrcB family protein [Lujinxingia vulgaris]|uniref:Fluoride-specific ion channel FluC n=1 Tax=Lujinxingia vulgaris TaxID=2600176 RepID=A0A5C6XDB7_9DELT|nr:CrcB family protein [Lujinxingia vulgaris]TXD36782.1 CrcB family protein [Lujinxingia vulgaris]